MNSIAMRSFAVVAITGALLSGAATTLEAQMAQVSGEWALQVTTDTGVTTPTMMIDQDGEALTGTYSSETLGEADFTGKVEGMKVTISFTANMQGQDIPVVYVGELGEDGVLSGTLDIAGGALAGSFKATKKEG